MRVAAAIIMAERPDVLSDNGFHLLLAWTSPSCPIGAFSYSHGLEAAVEEGQVREVAALIDYVAAVVTRGGGWVDAVLFVHGWRAAHDEATFDEVADLAAAFRGSSETALESWQQGRSLLAVLRKAWRHPAIDSFAQRRAGRDIAHVSVLALACAAHDIPLRSGLHAMLHGIAANLVSAGIRLVPLGQSDGQIATARLINVISATAERALTCSLDDLGTSALLVEMASLTHETQYTRLFRS